MIPLSGKTALITGAAKRLGRATALALATEGVNVVVHYHTALSDAESVAAEIRQAGVKAWTIAANLSRASDVESLGARVNAAAGPVDFLINNAAVFPESQLAVFPTEELLEDIRVNAVAPLLLARWLTQQGREGAIINFLDARITDYDKDHASYHLSKRMLFSLTRMMALEFAPTIRVNAVAPGLILPPKGKDESYLAELASTNPLERHGSAQDITDTVLFLLRSEFVTGQVVFVDGGRHLRGSVYG
ncbi:MAG: SDR family oxidoreductase [Candidatus Hydrogenedentes bacterium]|nr:SDR family oxidoreductase [Candidatus Hydrogenedentota bacterium]